MPRVHVRLLLLAVAALALTACGAAAQTAAPAGSAAMADQPADGTAMEQPTAAMAGDAAAGDTMAGDTMMEPTTAAAGDTMAGDTMMEPTAAAAGDTMAGDTMMEQPTAAVAGDAMAGDTMADRPAWQTLALTDARTGESFTLADFAGRTVYVEPMATWCHNCRTQLGSVRDARAQLDADQYVFVALSVETNISAADLARYADEQGFDWTFAVMTPELLQALSDTFGRTIANPPTTPHFIIRPDGTTTDLSTGIESADAIVAKLSEARGG